MDWHLAEMTISSRSYTTAIQKHIRKKNANQFKLDFCSRRRNCCFYHFFSALVDTGQNNKKKTINPCDVVYSLRVFRAADMFLFMSVNIELWILY